MQISDIHIHSLLKPFGEYKSGKKASNKPNNESSLWHNDSVSMIDSYIEDLAGVCLYTQSDFSSCAKGKVILVCLSIYAPEKEFFINRIENIPGSDILEAFITGFGKQRIKQIEKNEYNYFQDIKEQWDFLLKNSGTEDKKAVKINGEKWYFQVVSDKNQIASIEHSGKNIITIIPTFEGAHCLADSWLKEHPDSVNKVDWEGRINYVRTNCKPLFITFAHHFYNGLCGHVKSIPDNLNNLIDQSQGMNESITDMGWKVLDLMLLHSTNKILVDIKHMNVKSRRAFYQAWKSGRWGQFPIIFSHGGVNSRKSVFKDNELPQSDLFNDWDINLFDDEIIMIAQSGGLIGLNMDQRVMSSKKALKEASEVNNGLKSKSQSGIIFNHIKWIAELLDKNGLAAWDHICLGSDFDGMINPIDRFRTESEMKDLFLNLKTHITEFLNQQTLSSINRLSPDQITEKIAFNNMRLFVDKYYL